MMCGFGQEQLAIGITPHALRLGGVRTMIRHPVKAVGNVLGHKLEVIYKQHGMRKNVTPKIPKHPMQDVDQNMNEVITYNDLKLRWKWTTRFANRHLNIQRKWHPFPMSRPAPKPTCAFIWHSQMPHRQRLPEMPPSALAKSNICTKDAFAVFKSDSIHQHKVTVGDLVQCEYITRRQAGEKIVFGTVLLVGSKNWTIIGKPTVPYAMVKATIEQQTLAGEKIVFTYKSRKKQSKFHRRRQHVTMLRIDEIVVNMQEDPTDPPPPKPVRLLDLWANRWLDPEEKQGIEMVDGPDGTPVPKVSELYDGSEHQPGSYHTRGLTSCYRFSPDPQHQAQESHY